MATNITYNGDLRTTCTLAQSGTTILTDAPKDIKGIGEAFSPTDLVATALGTCIITIMAVKADLIGVSMEGATATVNKTMANNPRRIAKLEVTVTMPANNYTDRAKKSLLRAAHACPVARSLSADLEEVLEIVWL